MHKKVIFYGGVQGSGKTEILQKVAEKYVNYKSIFEEVRISDLFADQIRSDSRQSDKSKPILWGEINWKRYDDEVVEKLIRKICVRNKTFVLNGHFSIPFREKKNYLPGLEMSSLEKLIKRVFFTSKNKRLPAGKKPCLGVLLVEPEPSVILDYYINKYRESPEFNSALFYLSEQLIQKDLEENRNCSDQYYNTACSILGEENVCRKTIYLFQNGYDIKEPKEQLKSFFDMFLE